MLGIGLGLVLGQGAVRMVTQTINDLFFTLTVQDIAIPAGSIIKGMLIGVATTIFAAAPPAWEAANTTPRQALMRSEMEQKAGMIIQYAGWLGLVMIALGTGILMIPSTSIVLGFAGTFGILLGFAMLTPIITRTLMRILEKLFTNSPWTLLRLAPRQVSSALSRTSIAIAALMIAISVSIGVNLMVGSFRFTVITWMDQILSGDIYIGPPGSNLSLTDLTISPDVLDALEDWPDVERMDILRSVTVESPYGPITVGANNNPLDGQEQVYLWVDGSPGRSWEKVQQGAIFVSEPLARRLGLPLDGGTLTLYTDHGPHDFPIAGIYYDYSSAAGGTILWMEQYRAYWDDDKITAISIKLAPEADVDQTVRDLQTAITPIQSLLIRPNRALRADTLEIFDRTFTITSSLQLLTTLVAFIGVVSALLSLQLEKTAPVRPAAHPGADHSPALAADLAGNRADGHCLRPDRPPHRVCALADLDLHHQPALLRLDAANGRPTGTVSCRPCWSPYWLPCWPGCTRPGASAAASPPTHCASNKTMAAKAAIVWRIS